MRILVAFDGSAEAGRATRFAARFSSPLRARVTLLGVGSPRRAAVRRQQLEATADELAELGIEVVTKLGVGRPDRQLVDEIAVGGHDLLVLDDRTGLRVFPPWPSATRIVRAVPIPVLVATNAPGELRRILVCTGGDPPRGVEEYGLAARIAAATGASVEVLHVMSQVPLTGDVPKGAGLTRSAEWHVSRDTTEGQQLSSFVDLFSQHDVDADPRIRHGLVVDQIVREATGYGADLVVLGAHGTAGFLHLLLDDITEELIEHLDRPVLVVRPTPDRT